MPNKIIPVKSIENLFFSPSLDSEVFGKRKYPKITQASDSGIFTKNVLCQPPISIRRPPNVGPITAIVWLAIAKIVSTLVGLSWPVRSASLRIRYIEAGYPAQVPRPSNTLAATNHQRLGEKIAMKLDMPTNDVAIRKRSFGPKISINFPTTGCPIAVAKYRAETSQAVCEGGAPNAWPIGIKATEIIEELIGLRIDPKTIGVINF